MNAVFCGLGLVIGFYFGKWTGFEKGVMWSMETLKNDLISYGPIIAPKIMGVIIQAKLKKLRE